MATAHFSIVSVLTFCLLEHSFCQRTCTRTGVRYTTSPSVNYYSEPYSDNYGCGFWGWSRCSRTKYRSRTRTVYVQSSTYYTACCPGYDGIGCEAMCSPSCQNGGTCSSPNSCSCRSGWSGSSCSQPVCSPGCLNGGTCSSPNTCFCTDGWTGRACSQDVNECANENGGCHHTCSNTPGSFECSCRSGYSLASDGMTCNEPPAAPSNVQVSSVGQTTATVSWNPPPNNYPNTLTAVSSYYITASQHVFSEGNHSITKNAGTTNHHFTDLEEYTTYYFSVAASNLFGQGPGSDVREATTLQAAPSSAPLSMQTSSDSPYGITISWLPPPPVDRNGIILYYRVLVMEVETSTAFEWTSSDRTAERYSLHPYYLYECSVAAHTSAGTGPFTVSQTVQTLPSAPTAAPLQVRVSSFDAVSISLVWEPPPFSDRNGEIVQYHIRITEQESHSQFPYSTQQQQYTLSNLHPYYTYLISIAAETVEIGPFSSDLQQRTGESVPSSAPGDFTMVALNSTSMDLSWDELTYSERNGALRGYVVKLIEVETAANTEYNFISGPYTISHLHPNYTYRGKVTAVTIGIGPFSAISEVQLPESSPSGPPLHFVPETVLSRSILLSWQPPAYQDRNGIIIGYVIELSRSQEILTFQTENKTLLIDERVIKPFTQYTCRIAASTTPGVGPYSEQIRIYTPEDVPGIVNITDLSLIRGKPRQLFIQWDPPLEPNGVLLVYKVYCKRSAHQIQCQCNTSHQTFCSCGGTLFNTSFQQQAAFPVKFNQTEIIHGFMPYTSYTCFMTASTTAGESLPSDFVSAITDESVPDDPPLDFEIHVINSTALQLSWSQPSMPNGIVVAYSIIYNLSSSNDEYVSLDAQTTAYVVTNLNEFTVYNFTLYASTRVGAGPFTNLVARTNESFPGSPPRDITIFNVGKRSVDVSWIPPPPQDHNGPLTFYEIKFSQSQFDSIPTVSVHSLELFISYSDLEEYTNYTVVVAAATSTGLGPFSSAVIFTTREAAPSSAPLMGVGRAQSSSIISFDWAPPLPHKQNGVLRHYMATVTEVPTGRRWSFIAVESHIVLASLHPYYNYSCVVAAFTVDIGPYSAPFSTITYEEAPSAPPSPPHIFSFSSTSVMLTWEPPPAEHVNGKLRHYTVQYEEHETSLHQSITSNTTSTEIIGLHPHFTYTITVRAYTVSPGPFSMEVSVQLEEDAPTGSVEHLSGMPLHSKQLLLTWTPPPFIEQNGVIRSYSVYITETNTGSLMNYTSTSTNITVAELHPYYTYSCVITAKTVAEGPRSAPVIVTTLEDVPSGIVQDLEVSELFSQRAVFSWAPPELEYQNGIITKYQLIIMATGSNSSLKLNFSNTTGVVGNLKPYTTYQVGIAACTIVGIGPQSEFVTFRTLEDAPSAPPRDLEAVAVDSHTLVLSWSPPQPEHTNGILQGFTVTLIELATGERIFNNTASTSLTLSFLHPSYTYKYTVAASTTILGPASSVMNITMPEDVPSGAPSNISAVTVTSENISLEWIAPEPAERNGVILGYIIRYVHFQAGRSSTVEAQTTDVFISNLEPHNLYTFSIAARTTIGIGPFSENIQIRTAEAAPSSPPTNVTVDILDTTTAVISWLPPPPANHNGVIRFYIIILTERLTNSQVQLTAEATSEVLLSLHPSYTYEVSVGAVTTLVGPYSPVSVFHLPEDAPSGPPTNVKVKPISSNSLDIFWDPPLSAEQNGVITNYTVIVNDLDNDVTLVYVVSNTSLTVSLLDSHTDYEVYVFATTSGGNGPPSNPHTVRTHEDAPTHGPTNLTVIDVGPTHVHLTWCQPPNDTHQGIIRSYNIHILIEETKQMLFYTTAANVMELVLTSLHPFYTHHIKVAAVTVEEGNKTTLSVKTQEAAPAGPPQRVEVSINGPKSINITWLSPLAEDINGLIRHFTINITGHYKNRSILTSEHLYHSVQGLIPFINYSISVAAITVDTGPFSDLVTVEMPEAAPTLPPTNISTNILNSKQLLVSWIPPVKISRNGIIRMYIIAVINIEANVTTTITSEYTDVLLSLLPFRRYIISVAAVTVMEGPFSDYVSIEMPEDVPIAPPQDVQVNNITSNSVIISWNEPDVDFHNGIIRYYAVHASPKSLEVDSIVRTTSERKLKMIGLHPFTTYDVKVIAFTVGLGPASDTITFRTMEAVPSGEPAFVEVLVLNSTAISLSWNTPMTVDINGIITNYVVLLSSIDGLNTTYIVQLEELVIGGLQPFTIYAVAVASENSIGVGPFTRSVLVQTLEDAPSAPRSLTFENLSSVSLHLLWESPPEDEHNGIIRFYEIHVVENDTGLVQRFKTTEITYALSNLHPYYYYTIHVHAVTIRHGEPSEELFVKTLEDVPSGPPLNISVNVLNSTFATVAWEAPSLTQRNGEIIHYLVNITSIEADTFSTLSHLRTQSPFLALDDLHPFYTYHVRVAAATSVDTGPYSTIHSFTMAEAAPSGPPLNFTALSISPSSILLSWEAPTITQQNGLIRSFSILLTDLLTLRQSVHSVDSHHSQKIIDMLHPHRLFECAVAAVTVEIGVYSPSVIVQTQDDVPSRPPSAVTAWAINTTSISAMWNSLDDDFHNGILLHYSLRLTELHTGRVTLNKGNVTQMLLTSLHPFYSYDIEVAAATRVGAGPYSMPFRVTTHSDVPTGSPMDVEIISITSTSVSIAWSSPSPDKQNGAIFAYSVLIAGVKDNLKWIVNSTDPYTSNVILSHLEPFLAYNLSVSAININGSGPYSPPLRFMTAPAAPGAAPIALTAENISSQAVSLSWLPPPAELQNGIIQEYKVDVIEMDTNMRIYFKSLSTKMTLEHLHPYYTYQISVAAVTVTVGPYATMTVTTLEDVPSGPPQHLTVLFVSSTTVSLSWDPPSIQDQNGVIVQYHIYICNELLKECTMETSEETLYTVSGLHPFYTYYINVAAATIDVGPSSSYVAVTCLEDAPSGPPRNITIEAITSSSVNMMWSPPVEMEQNGVVRHYVVIVTDLQSSERRQFSVLTNEITVPSLHPYYDYACSVAAVTVDSGPYSSPVVVKTLQDVPSGFPTNVSVYVLNSTTINVSWMPPVHDKQNGIIQWYCILLVETESQKRREINGSNTLSITVSQLHPYYTYEVSVAAVTISVGPLSDSMMITMPQDAPSSGPRNVWAVSLSPYNIDLHWDAPNIDQQNGDIVLYDIMITHFASGTNHSFQVAGNNSHFSGNTFHPYYTYCVSVYAVTIHAGPGASINITTKETVPSSPPIDVTARASSPTEANLAWKPPVVEDRNGHIREYAVIRVAIPSGELFEFKTNSTQLDFRNLQPYGNYFFIVAAKTISLGPFSAQIFLNMPEASPSSGVQNISLTIQSTNSVEMRWLPPPITSWNGIIQNYTIFVDYINPAQQINASEALHLLNYSFTKIHPSHENRLSNNRDPHLVSLPLRYEAIFIGNLEEFQVYQFSIAVANSVGWGETSMLIIQELPGSEPSGAPVNIQVRVLSSTSIKVLWDPPLFVHRNGIINAYWIEVTNVASSPVMVFNATTDELVITIFDLEGFMEYCVIITAENFEGRGPPSNPIHFKTLEDIPSAPINLSVAQVGEHSVLVSWNTPEHPNGVINNYMVWYSSILSLDENEQKNEDLYTVAITEAHNVTIDNFTIGVTYSIKVRAHTSVGYGQYSNQISFTLELLASSQPSSTGISSSSKEEDNGGIIIIVVSLVVVGGGLFTAIVIIVGMMYYKVLRAKDVINTARSPTSDKDNSQEMQTLPDPDTRSCHGDDCANPRISGDCTTSREEKSVL